MCLECFNGTLHYMSLHSRSRISSKEWDRFLPQATLTLNQLHNCCFNPKLSSHSALHSTFDSKKTTLYSLETKFLVLYNKSNCRTKAPCDKYGWYIGPDLENYWCVECYIPSAHSTQNIAHSTQHTAHSTQHTAHSTQHTEKIDEDNKDGSSFSYFFQLLSLVGIMPS